MLKNGVGHISRHSALMPTEQIARTMNAIQGILVEETRLSVPAIFHEESCAGFLAQDASCFPMPLAIASTFAPELVEKMGTVIRRQMLAVGARHTLAPVVDVVRDARWGRCEETFGEDVYLVARMAVAYVKGVQGDDLTRGVDLHRQAFRRLQLFRGRTQLGARAHSRTASCSMCSSRHSPR